jgi:hypothetical protein
MAQTTEHPHPPMPAWEYPLTRALALMAQDFDQLDDDVQAFVARVLDAAADCFGDDHGSEQR